LRPIKNCVWRAGTPSAHPFRGDAPEDGRSEAGAAEAVGRKKAACNEYRTARKGMHELITSSAWLVYRLVEVRMTCFLYIIKELIYYEEYGII
jgi:hypothetical protein